MYELLEPYERIPAGAPTRMEVEQVIPLMHFACNLSACRGACCTLPGGRGAPLLDEEVPLLESSLASVRPYLAPRNLEVLERSGPVCGEPGDYSTACIENRDCVFVMYDKDIALCSLERAFLEGQSSWRKPLSCHLFPIRVDRGRIPRLRFEFLNECSPALAQGQARGTYLTDFVRDALVRAYGEDWCSAIEHHCRIRRNDADSRRAHQS